MLTSRSSTATTTRLLATSCALCPARSESIAFKSFACVVVMLGQKYSGVSPLPLGWLVGDGANANVACVVGGVVGDEIARVGEVVGANVPEATGVDAAALAATALATGVLAGAIAGHSAASGFAALGCVARRPPLQPTPVPCQRSLHRQAATDPAEIVGTVVGALFAANSFTGCVLGAPTGKPFAPS